MDRNAPTPAPSEVLRFLHVSDIHFNGYWDKHPKADYESAVRREMLMDFSRLHSSLGPIGGILVVGDIANRGIAAEYEKATNFLESAARLIGCAPQAIVCVPGNHDVNRGSQTLMHEHFRYKLRNSPVSELSDLLLQAINDEDLARTLLAPFADYNTFAAKYQCDFTAEKPMFAPKEFALGDLRVRVHGVNTSWICDGLEKNSHATESLVAGTFQALRISDEPMVLSLAMAHHPKNWLRDGVELSSWFANAHLVLTGHEHLPSISFSAEGRPLHIASGAVNPTRGEEGWLPAYNVIELKYVEAESTVAVTVHPRVWQVDRKAEFNYPPGRDGPDTYFVPIRQNTSVAPPGGDGGQLQPSATSFVPQPPDDVHAPAHIHIHTILKAPTDIRHRAAREMSLLEEHEGLEAQVDQLIVRRAAARGLLSRLAATVEEELLDA